MKDTLSDIPDVLSIVLNSIYEMNIYRVQALMGMRLILGVEIDKDEQKGMELLKPSCALKKHLTSTHLHTRNWGNAVCGMTDTRMLSCYSAKSRKRRI